MIRKTCAVLSLVALAVVVAMGCAAPATPPPPATPAPPLAVAPIGDSAAAPSSPATPLPARAAPPAAAVSYPTATPQPSPAEVAAVRAPKPAPLPTPIPVTFPLTLVDGNGKPFTFQKPPERIVAFDSAVVEILFAIGEGRRVVGTHSFVSYPPGTAAIERVGDAFNMNVEKVVSLQPDLVFVFFDRFVPELKAAGLPVLYLPTLSHDFAKVADDIRTWGRITGSPDSAEAVAREFEANVAAIRETLAPYTDGPSVFQDVGDFWTPGDDTLVGEVFALLKLGNIAGDVEGYAQLSPEVIVERDPQIILTGVPAVFYDNPAFRNVAAVKNRQVFEMSFDFFSVAGPRFDDWIAELADWVYGPLFARQ